MASGYTIRKNQYYDSVFLMGVNSRLSKAAGLRQTAVLMGSEKNKALLVDLGIRGGAIDAAGANDLVIAVVADDAQAVQSALDGVDAALLAVEATTTPSEVHSLQDGLRLKPGANLAVLTIPGDYVYPEAIKALEAGLHVFIFSSNVSLEHERELIDDEKDSLVPIIVSQTSKKGGSSFLPVGTNGFLELELDSYIPRPGQLCFVQ